MINLEGLAAKLTETLYSQEDIGEVERARIEYGFSLTLGVGLAFVVIIAISALLGTLSQSLLLVAGALGLRIFSGGAHCSSYDRCLVLSLLVFIPLSILTKYLSIALAPKLPIIYLVSLAVPVIYLLVKNWKLAGLAVLINVAIVSLGYLSGHLPGFLLPVAAGTLVQTLMLTRIGEGLVSKVDAVLVILGI